MAKKSIKKPPVVETSGIVDGGKKNTSAKIVKKKKKTKKLSKKEQELFLHPNMYKPKYGLEYRNKFNKAMAARIFDKQGRKASVGELKELWEKSKNEIKELQYSGVSPDQMLFDNLFIEIAEKPDLTFIVPDSEQFKKFRDDVGTIDWFSLIERLTYTHRDILNPQDEIVFDLSVMSYDKSIYQTQYRNLTSYYQDRIYLPLNKDLRGVHSTEEGGGYNVSPTPTFNLGKPEFNVDGKRFNRYTFKLQLTDLYLNKVDNINELKDKQVSEKKENQRQIDELQKKLSEQDKLISEQSEIIKQQAEFIKQLTQSQQRTEQMVADFIKRAEQKEKPEEKKTIRLKKTTEKEEKPKQQKSKKTSVKLEKKTTEKETKTRKPRAKKAKGEYYGYTENEVFKMTRDEKIILSNKYFADGDKDGYNKFFNKFLMNF